MNIDNSRAQAFRRCPDFFKERYINNLEKDWGTTASPFEFGRRMHQLLELRLLALKGDFRDLYYPPSAIEPIELECQSTLAGYSAHWPSEPFDVVDVERVFAVAIPGTEHVYTGKFDAIIRYNEAPFKDQLAILEHKTEGRNARTNTPESWAARSQVSLYIWAAERVYGERPRHILLDVLRRASEKGQEPATFYRDILERTVEQSESAINDLVYVADSIEHLERSYDPTRWPQNTNECCVRGWKCDYFTAHVIGDTSQYKEAAEYLSSL